MGCVDTIRVGKFPKQGNQVDKRVKCCFHYDTTKYLTGVIVRDDREEPGRTIIKLDNGNYILGVECQYSWE